MCYLEEKGRHSLESHGKKCLFKKYKDDSADYHALFQLQIETLRKTYFKNNLLTNTN